MAAVDEQYVAAVQISKDRDIHLFNLSSNVRDGGVTRQNCPRFGVDTDNFARAAGSPERELSRPATAHLDYLCRPIPRKKVVEHFEIATFIVTTVEIKRKLFFLPKRLYNRLRWLNEELIVFSISLRDRSDHLNVVSRIDKATKPYRRQVATSKPAKE